MVSSRMNMDTIEIKGIKYEKASRIAKNFSYTSDYVGQLCREGKVRAEQVGRAWYIDPESVVAYQEHRYETDEITDKKNSDQTSNPEKKIVVKKEHSKSVSTSDTHQRGTELLHKSSINWQVSQPAVPVYRPFFSYEADSAELLPITKKNTNEKELSSDRKSLAVSDGAVNNALKNKDISQASNQKVVSAIQGTKPVKIKKYTTIAEVNGKKLTIPATGTESLEMQNSAIVQSPAATLASQASQEKVTDIISSERSDTPMLAIKTVGPNISYRTSRKDLLKNNTQKRQLSMFFLPFFCLVMLLGVYLIAFFMESSVVYSRDADELNQRFLFTVPISDLSLVF